MTDIASLYLKVDSTQVDGGAKSLDQLAQSGGKAEASTTALTSATNILANAARIAAGAFGAFKLVQYAREATLLAARYETMGIVMKVAGNNAGYNSAQMDKYSKALQKNGISMLQSRDALTQLATANIDLAKASEIGRAAQDLAVVGNVNSSEAMNRMIHGIKSGQIEVLRTLGLNVSFEESYKNLAAELHKNVDALSAEEKALARTNAVLSEAKNYAGIYEESMTTAGKAMSSLIRYSENLQIKIGNIFLPALADAVFQYTDALKAANAEMDKLGSAGSIDRIGVSLGGAFKTVYETVVVLAANVGYVFTAIGNEIGGIAAQVAAVLRGDFAGVSVIHKEMIAGAEAGRKAIDAFSERMLNHGNVVKTVSKYTEEAAIKRGNAARAQADADDKAAVAADKAQKAYAAQQQSINSIIDSLEKEAATYGMTAEQVRIYEAAMKGANFEEITRIKAAADAVTALKAEEEATKAISKAQTEATKAGSRAREEAIRAEKAAQASFWSSIERTAHDTFVSIMDGGKDAATRLRDTFKNIFFDWLYQMTIKKWIVNVSGVVGTSSAGAANAGGIGSLFTGGSGGIGGIATGGLLASGALGTFGTGIASAMATGVTAGFTNGIAAIGLGQTAAGLGMMVPMIGAAVGGALVLSKLFKHRGGPGLQNTGGATMSFDSGGGVTSSTGGAFGVTNVAAQNTINDLQNQYSSTAASLGITQRATSYHFGQNQLTDGSNKKFRLAGGGYDTGEIAQTEEALQNAASRAIFSALQGSEMPSYLRSLFDSVVVATASSEDLSSVLQYAATLKQVRDALTETRSPLELFRANVADGLSAVGATAETFKQDFIAAIDAGMDPAQLEQWQQLGMAIDQLAQVDAEAAAQAAQEAARAAESIAQAARAIANERYSLETQLLQAQGDTAALRARELATIDVSNQAIQEQIWAIDDKATADALAAQAAQEAAQAQAQAQAAQAQAAQAQAQAQAQAAQEAARAAAQIKSAWQSVTDLLFEEVARIRGLNGAGSTASAQSQFAIATAQARAGDQEAAKLLPQLSQALIAASEATATSAYELAITRGRIAGSLATTALGLAGQHGLELPSFSVGSDYVPYNMVAQIHKGERIIPAATNDEMVGELRALRQEVASLRASSDQTATATRKTSDLLRNVTQDGNSLLTTAA